MRPGEAEVEELARLDLPLTQAFDDPQVPLLRVRREGPELYTGRFERPASFKWRYRLGGLRPVVIAAANSIAVWVRVETRQQVRDGQRVCLVEAEDESVRAELWRCRAVYRRANDPILWVGRQADRPPAEPPWDWSMRIPAPANRPDAPFS